MARPTAADPAQRLRDLSPANRRAVHDAIVNSALEGWTPDPEAVGLLADFAAGNITIEDYRARVIAKATDTRP
jgi:hypothetical protein